MNSKKILTDTGKESWGGLGVVAILCQHLGTCPDGQFLWILVSIVVLTFAAVGARLYMKTHQGNDEEDVPEELIEPTPDKPGTGKKAKEPGA